MSSKTVRIGLIGLGRMGQNHLRVLSLLKGVELAFIADADAAVARRLGDQFDVPGVSDVDPVLASADAVVICTPTVTHADYIRLAAG